MNGSVCYLWFLTVTWTYYFGLLSKFDQSWMALHLAQATIASMYVCRSLAEYF